MNRVCIGCGKSFTPTRAGNRCERCVRPRRNALGRPHRRRKAKVLSTTPTCVYCGAPATHLDHRVPVSDGGGNEAGNLVAACQSCNLRKGGTTEGEFRRSGWLERRRELVRMGQM